MRAAKMMAGALGAAGLGGAMIATGKAAVRFESQMAEVGVVTKANARQMSALSDAALDLGSKTGKGAGKAAEAIKELAKGGIDAEQILGGGLKGAMDLAAAGGMDVAEAAVSVSDALNLFGLKGKRATHVADAFAKAANDTTADVSHFTQALSQSGGAAKAAGLSFDETVVALEAMALAGVKGSDAGTSLKAALSQIVKPTKESGELMKKLGLEFFNAEGNMKPLSQVAGMLQAKMKGLTREQRLSALQTIAGTDGFRSLLALYEQGAPGVDKLSKGLREQGTAADVAKAKLDTVKGGFDRVKSSLESLVVAGTGGGMGGVADGLNGIADAVDKIREGESLTEALGLGDVDLDKVFGGSAKSDMESYFEDMKGAASGAVDLFDSLFGDVDFGDFGRRMVDSFTGGLSAMSKVAKSAITLDLGGVLDGLGDFAQSAAEQVGAIGGVVVDLFTKPFKSAVDEVLGLITGLGDAAAGIFGAMASVDPSGVFGKMEKQLRKEIDSVNEFRESLRAPVKLKVDADSGPAKAELDKIQNTNLKDAVMRVLGETTDAKAKFDALVALGIPPKRAYVLAETGDAMSKIGAVSAALNAIGDKVVRLTTLNITKNQTQGGGGGGGSAPRRTPPSARQSGPTASTSASKAKRQPYEIAAAMADMDLARAEGTSDGGLDNARALQAQRKAARQRLSAVNKKLKQKIKTEDRARLLSEKAGLYGDLNRIKAAEQDLKVPPSTSVTDLAVAQADVQVALAAITAGTDDDITALGKRQAALAKRITAITMKLKQKGLRRDDKTRLNEELSRLLGEKKSTAEDIFALQNPEPAKPEPFVNPFDALLTAGDAALAKAQVFTPKDKADDEAALRAQLSTATGAFTDAIARGDDSDVVRFGNLITSLNSSIEGLKDATEDQTAILQSQLDVQREQLEQQSRTIATQGANLRGLEKFIAGVADGSIGSAAGARRNIPFSNVRYA